MVDPRTNGCPEPEVLAAYVDQGLSLAERARVDAHLASCQQCLAWLAGVVRTVAEVSAHVPDAVVTPEATPMFTRRSLAGALAAAAAVIAVIALPSLVGPWLDRDAGLVSLVDSVGEQRSVLGRLTGGFPHAPLGVPSAGGQDGRASGTDRVLLTAGKIRESFGERETPSQLHAIGVSQLLAGHYDDAAQALLAASREQPANAKYLSDVAAVQLERARLGLRPDDLPRALAAADRARTLDPSLKEAWFNRALAATSLSLTAEAKNAWNEYLKRDSSSPWASEARSRLAELARPTVAAAWTAIEGELQAAAVIEQAAADTAVRTHVTESRKFIENELIPAWASVVLEGRDATTHLERVRVMASAMMRIAGDALYLDAVSAIDRSGREKGIRAIAEAHSSYATAASAYASDDFARAIPLLREAREKLLAVQSPFYLRPSMDLASVIYPAGGSVESEQLAAEALSAAQRHQYAFVEARAAWVQGLAAFYQGRLADAQSKYESTLATFERIGDLEQISAAHTLLAGLFYYLGDQNQAWIHFVPALKGLDITRSLKLRHALLSAAATSIRDSNPEGALAIQNEAIRNAEKWGLNYAVVEARAARASLLAILGRTEIAEADLAAAKLQMPGVEPSIRSRLEVTVLATEAKLLRTKNPAAAVAAATRAIHLVEERGDRFRLPQLQLELAKANIVWGRASEAEVALEQGIRAFDQERSSSVDEARVSVRDEAWGLFETAVHLALKKNDLERAFALAERGRMRSLAEARREPVSRPLSSIRASLDQHEAIIALNQFDDELAVWVIRQSGADVYTRPLSRRDAERLIARQQREIWLQSPSAEAGEALYNEILRPLTEQLATITRLVVVPDATYESVSFAALSDSNSSKFLVENVILNVAPSANAFVAARAHSRAAADTLPLVFGGTSEEAVAGARAVAAAYQTASVVAGASATRSKFFTDLQSSRGVVHISVPVFVSSSNPLLSRAIVADDPGLPHSGAILGRDIANRTLTNTNLVVIDEVPTNRTIRGEGTLSMARAFMTAGAPAVVGTLPGADEYATRDLMIGFHREMSRGISAEQALHTVQRNAIAQNGRRLGAWSALVIYGSDR